MTANSFACPKCQVSLRAARPLAADRQVRCPQCGTPFVVSAAVRPPLPAPVTPPFLSRSQGWAILGTIVLVGAGIIAAIVLTRGGRNPEAADPNQRAETPAVRPAPADSSPKEAVTAMAQAVAPPALPQVAPPVPAKETAAPAPAAAQAALPADEAQKQKLAAYQAHVTAGQAALADGRYADGLREYQAALRLVPGDAAALEGQRLAERQLAALQDEQQRKADYARLVDQGGAAMKNRRFQEALDRYAAALNLIKDDAVALRGQAEAQQALNNLRAELARQLTLGDAALRTGRFADAVAAYGAAVRLDPANLLAAKGLQDAQVALTNAQAAQTMFLQWMNQGAAALRGQRFAEAVQAYTEALRLVPTDLNALQGLRDARAGLDRVVVNPGDFDREFQRAMADLQQQRFPEAVRHFKRALKLRPDDPQAVRGLRQARFGEAMADGRAAVAARRYTDAVRSFEDALRELPGDPTALTALRQARTLANMNAKGS
jgi:tetratricopeptide (TPR) repeat protein